MTCLVVTTVVITRTKSCCVCLAIGQTGADQSPSEHVTNIICVNPPEFLLTHIMVECRSCMVT